MRSIGIAIGACILGVCTIALAQATGQPVPVGGMGALEVGGGTVGGGAVLFGAYKLLDLFLRSRRSDDAPGPLPAPRNSGNAELLAALKAQGDRTDRLLELGQITNNLLAGLGEKFVELADQIKDQRRSQLSQHEDQRRDHETIKEGIRDTKEDLKETKRDVEETKTAVTAVTMLLREKTGS